MGKHNKKKRPSKPVFGNAAKRIREEKEAQRAANPDVDGADKGWLVDARTQAPLVLSNPRFDEYYTRNAIIPPEEWEQFMSTMQQPLPTNFRITGTRTDAVLLRTCLLRHFYPQLKDLKSDSGEPIEPVALSWYPDNMAWHVNASRTLIRKHAQLNRLKKFLFSCSDRGNICRQEAVSMIPPILLDVKPHHFVLDMCAAPGSKTAQIVEALHADDHLHPKRVCPPGLVVANDADVKRCYMLTHQMKRLQSPSLIVTNHDASQFPTIYIADPKSPISRGRPLTFDRILCDVPCTGDGTLRKNLPIWNSWSVKDGLSLHPLQIRILIRGLELLNVGGLIVYSTCSLNPVENEAVLTAVLQKFAGAVELVDVSDKLPGLKRNPGLESWLVKDEATDYLTSFDQIPADAAEGVRNRLPRTVFAPSAEEAKRLNLRYAMRLLPHHQDTGGFFVSVLRKTGSIGVADRVIEQMNSSAPSTAAPPSSSEFADANSPVNAPAVGELSELQQVAEKEARNHEIRIERYRRTNHNQLFKEDPFLPLATDSRDVAETRRLFGFEGFPFEQLVVRSESAKKRSIYLVGEPVRQILNATNLSKLQIVNTGVKLMFGSGMEDCTLRLSTDGLHISKRFVTGRSIQVSKEDLRALIKAERVGLSQLSETLQAQVNSLPIGSAILEFDPTLDDPELKQELYENDRSVSFVAWRGVGTLSVQVAKEERTPLGMVLFGEWDDTYIPAPKNQKNPAEDPAAEDPVVHHEDATSAAAQADD